MYTNDECGSLEENANGVTLDSPKPRHATTRHDTYFLLPPSPKGYRGLPEQEVARLYYGSIRARRRGRLIPVENREHWERKHRTRTTTHTTEAARGRSFYFCPNSNLYSVRERDNIDVKKKKSCDVFRIMLGRCCVYLLSTAASVVAPGRVFPRGGLASRSAAVRGRGDQERGGERRVEMRGKDDKA